MAKLFTRKLAESKFIKSSIVDLFHRLYYYKRPETWSQNEFLGYPIWQCPFDLHTYQELVFRHRPPFIIQTGVSLGGSILYFASLLDLVGADPSALVVGVDIHLTEKAKTLTHPRIRLIEGSSIDPKVIEEVQSVLPAERGMVILDSDHSEQHVFSELLAYRRFVEYGHYLVVEDTNINGHPVYKTFGPGPFEAVERFLEQDRDFVRDDSVWKQHLFSFHQHGWLRRVEI